MIMDFYSLFLGSLREKDKEKVLVFKTIYESKNITRKKIILEHKLRPSTVSNIILEMIEDSIIVEIERKVNTGRGRPELILEINYSLFWIITFTLISMDLTASIVNLKGETVRDHVIKLDETIDSEYFIKKVISISDKFQSVMPLDSKFLGIGFTLPGLLDKRSINWKIVSRFPRIKNVDLSIICKIKPTIIERNVDTLLNYCLQTKKETLKGTTLLIHWGYGISISCSMEGKILKSTNGLFGEIGHWEGIQATNQIIESAFSMSPILKDLGWLGSYSESNIAEIVQSGTFPQQTLGKITEAMGKVIKNLFLTFFPDRIYILSPFITNESLYRIGLDLKKSIPDFIIESPSIHSLDYSEKGELLGILNLVFSKTMNQYLKARW